MVDGCVVCSLYGTQSRWTLVPLWFTIEWTLLGGMVNMRTWGLMRFMIGGQGDNANCYDVDNVN